VFVVGLFVALVPSPKVQLKVYGLVPPDAEAANVTCCPVSGEAGVYVKLVVSAGGGFATVIV